MDEVGVAQIISLDIKVRIWRHSVAVGFPTHELKGSCGGVLGSYPFPRYLAGTCFLSPSQDADPLTHSGVVTPLLACGRSSPYFTHGEPMWW